MERNGRIRWKIDIGWRRSPHCRSLPFSKGKFDIINDWKLLRFDFYVTLTFCLFIHFVILIDFNSLSVSLNSNSTPSPSVVRGVGYTPGTEEGTKLFPKYPIFPEKKFLLSTETVRIFNSMIYFKAL